MKYRMSYFGSSVGRESKKVYTFDKDEIIEAPKGDFDDSLAVKESTESNEAHKRVRRTKAQIEADNAKSDG